MYVTIVAYYLFYADRRSADNGTNVTAQIVDYCPDCSDTYVGLSSVGFEEFASTDQGIVSNVTWEIV